MTSRSIGRFTCAERLVSGPKRDVSPARPPQAPDDAPLNPALKQVYDSSYGPGQNGTDPMDTHTVSVQKDEGSAWPMIWAVTTIVCDIIAMVLIVL